MLHLLNVYSSYDSAHLVSLVPHLRQVVTQGSQEDEKNYQEEEKVSKITTQGQLITEFFWLKSKSDKNESCQKCNNNGKKTTFSPLPAVFGREKSGFCHIVLLV